MPPKKASPIDPLNGQKLILQGRAITMDATFNVIVDARIYIDKGIIVAIQNIAAPAPAGFDGVGILQTKGTIYPGLIELHNHLAYNALQLWHVPKLYSNRNQWAGTTEYRKLISGPMQIVGKSPDLVPALSRVVEAKCLLAGVTTSQGIALYSNAGARKFYRGVVRNVEQTDEPDLPEAATRIPDIDAADVRLFKNRLLKQSCFLLHLSEGKDETARNAFRALRITPDDWAITPALAGIHCAALEQEDFATMARFGGSMVWSPLSNLLLYGDTAKVKAAKLEGVRIGLGSDWSPSGSKNLLGELKVAKLWSDENNLFTDRELVEMATRSGANIVGWEKVLGSLEVGKRADLIVLDGDHQDPYSQLIQSHETNVALVMINGIPRFGLPAWMKTLGVTATDSEPWSVGGKARALFLKQVTQDPDVANLSLKLATEKLRLALKKLPALAAKLEKPQPAAPLGARKVVWQLALDEIENTGAHLRPNLPFAHTHTGPRPMMGKGAQKLSEVVTPLVLDPLTVVDDADFIDRIEAQKNLPDIVRVNLRTLY
jgi:cytosine/adenosine deaminase-related metal-dependent hydrolase